MVLSNAERQRRFREKAAAKSNSADTEVLALRERNAWLEARVIDLEALVNAAPAPVVAPAPTPAHDPRQLDLEDAIRATTTTAETENQVAVTTANATLDHAQFAAAVKAARLARGWKNVAPLSKATGLAESTLRNIECGQYRTSQKNRARLVAILNLEPV